MTTTESSDALTWLSSAPLAGVWIAARRRLERNGLTTTGTVTVRLDSPSVRQAVGGLLGQPVTGERVRVDLAELDAKLRASAAALGLVAVIEHITGPLTDRPAARAQIAERRDALWAHVDDLLADAGLADEPWVEPWLNEIRRAGTLTRLGDEARNMAASAVAVLRTTLGPVPATPIGRNVLAQQYSGSAHGLDDSTVLGRLVLRALAHAFGVPNPMSAADRRVLWRAAGVAPDNVSTTVLTIGLRPTGSVFADLHRQRTDAGAETHLDDRDVARINWELPAGTVVHVCENPRIVEDALDVGIDAPLVCTLGSPTTVAANLVTGLLEGGAHLRYHGDFDWPGIAITARMLKLGCEPWRMTAADYEEALAIATPLVGNLPALVGEPVPTPWDRELAAAMNAIGRVVHEEALVAVLLGDLAGS